jgi:hypothetical protein
VTRAWRAAPAEARARLVPPFRVTLTRVSPGKRRADLDNAIAGLKACQDQVAAELLLDDGDRRISWRYAQARGPFAVRIRVESTGPATLPATSP